jgi:RHS repeat-associated protein
MLQDIGASSQTASFTYDAVGNMVTATDQASHTTQHAFDALNRLYKITDPASGITTTSYDAHDRPLTVTAPSGVVTTYVYDGLGDLIQESNPNTGTTAYSYDSTGNMIKRTAATGAVTQYTYDALDRVLTKTYPSDSTENVTYTYDQSGHGAGIGRLTSVTDAAGTLSRSYDQLGNLLTETRTKGTVVLNTAYTYDAASRIASIAYPSGATVSYTRDTMGRITAVAAQPTGGASTPVVSNVTYEPFGPYKGLTNGNGVAEARGFDQDYRLTGITDISSSSTLQSLAYAYYPTNNVQTITNAVASSQTFGSTSTSYGYGTGSDLLATLSVGGVVTQAIGYTADGRIASLNPGIQAPAGQYITSLSYNQDGRLAAVDAAGGSLAGYTYDGFGQRIVKTISGAAGNIYQYGQDGLLLEETNASGVAQADYIYLNGRPVAVLNGSTLYYLHDDMLGTPQLATDSNQAVQWQASYDPFGQASVSGTITQNLRLPGQYFDVESGWNHNGFRDYAPTLGRYIEPDPLAFLVTSMEGHNPYSYAENNPVLNIDPLGLIDFIYNETDTKNGWGILMTSNTKPSARVTVNCKCQVGGQWKASVTVYMDLPVYYGTDSDLAHEREHIQLMKNNFHGRLDDYSKKYEHNYPSYSACKNIASQVLAEIKHDYDTLNKGGENHVDDWLEQSWNWLSNGFKKLAGNK